MGNDEGEEEDERNGQHGQQRLSDKSRVTPFHIEPPQKLYLQKRGTQENMATTFIFEKSAIERGSSIVQLGTMDLEKEKKIEKTEITWL